MGGQSLSRLQEDGCKGTTLSWTPFKIRSTSPPSTHTATTQVARGSSLLEILFSAGSRETTSDCGSEETIKATLCFLLKEMEKGHKTIKKKGSPPECDLFLEECDPLSDD